ncbi:FARNESYLCYSTEINE LYASE [Salix purpurea]|uniref:FARNESYLCYSTEINE LYASE n=1 Tax=Salix purpurea TaxID=77065 RepID=A0A9Q0ZNG6_SALPP|nr:FARNESYLCYSTEINE LYASE [Salix purpurea]
MFLFPLKIFSLLALFSFTAAGGDGATVCIIGSGIGGSSVAHFLRRYSTNHHPKILIFERQAAVGGRIASVTIGGEAFEAGASILHPKNYHAWNCTNLLNLTRKRPSSSEGSFSLGIWDGDGFVVKTLNLKSSWGIVNKIASFFNGICLFMRYGFSLVKMEGFVDETVNKFLKYYEGVETRPVFESADEMLKWAGLFNLTGKSLKEELVDGVKLAPLLIKELVTVTTRVNYGQSVDISGLAGAVSLAGSGRGVWAVEGGNWQMAAGLINISDVELHLHEEIDSISYLGAYYELNSTKGNAYSCEVTVVATPLDESSIQFSPPVSVPARQLQHTHATFVRGLVNPVYFGLKAASEIPELVATIEDPRLPFTSISILKCYNETDMTYKVFSRQAMTDALLDSIFSVRKETVRINWGAYPHYKAPEKFAPFILDGKHLYYVNAFENAASTVETSAVAAENIARLILSRFFGKNSLMSIRHRENLLFQCRGVAFRCVIRMHDTENIRVSFSFFFCFVNVVLYIAEFP